MQLRPERPVLGFDSEFCRHCDYYLATAITPDGTLILKSRDEARSFLAGLTEEHIVSAHYGRADWKALGVYPLNATVYDSLTLGWLVDEEPLHGLKARGPRFLNRPFDDPITVREATGETLFRGVHITEADQAEVTKYCAADSAGSRDLTLTYLRMLSEPLLRWYREVEVPLDYVLYLCETRGLAVNEELMASEIEKLKPEVADLEKKVQWMVGYDFNINSAQQLGNVLYKSTYTVMRRERQEVGEYKNGKPKFAFVEVPEERQGLGLTPKKATAAGAPSTDKEALTAHAGIPVIDALLEYNTMNTALTYLMAYPRYVTGGRMRGTFKQAGTVTGRLSSSDPNLMNIPRRGPLGKRIRKLFIAEPGNRLVVADLDQIEYRILAALSGEKKLIEAFVNGEDVHSKTAAIMGVESRDVGKTGNYAAVYECGPNKFAQLCTMAGTPTTGAQAKALLEKYYAELPAVLWWKNAVKGEALSSGVTYTLGRRMRHLPDLKSKDNGLRARALRQSVNSVIQGSAADLVKLWMVLMQRKGIPMLAQIHDEVIVEVPEAEAEATGVVMVECLTKAARLLNLTQVPVTTTPKIAETWGDAK
jgi:DNA polymerase-1